MVETDEESDIGKLRSVLESIGVDFEITESSERDRIIIKGVQKPPQEVHWSELVFHKDGKFELQGCH